MITNLSGKHQRQVALLLFFIFYGELAASVYAGKGQILAGEEKRMNSMWSHSRSYFSNPLITNNNLTVLPQGASLEVAGGIDKDSVERKRKKGKATSSFIGGPSQPEMSGFKSIGADNMVNLFTGDFSYSIPLGKVGEYPINLFYSGGVSMDQEASWVGLGWNLNPGTISRNMRGIPDDYNKVDKITKEQSIKSDRTIGVTASKNVELWGLPISATASLGIFYNNRRGLGLEVGLQGEMSTHQLLASRSKDEKTTKDTVKTGASIGGGVSLNSQEGMSYNGSFEISKFSGEKQLWGVGTGVSVSSRQGLTDISITGQSKWYEKQGKFLEYIGKNFLSTHNSSISFARSSFTPSIRMPVSRFNASFTLKMGKSKKILFSNGTLTGYVQDASIKDYDKTQTKPAYGYMYYEKAQNDKDALMDFNRINDGVYTFKTPLISIPVYTYDVFSISGEGTGGSFRGYRGNMGYVRDHYMSTRTGSLSISLELGAGSSSVHLGGTLGGIFTPSYVEEWDTQNRLRYNAAFKSTDSIYQGFYFKNPGEKAIIDEDYYHQVGEDRLIRPYLADPYTATPSLASSFQAFDKERNVESTLPVTPTSHRRNRDKRGQVITYFTAFEAQKVSLNKFFYSYKENVFRPGSCLDSSMVTPVYRYFPDNPGFYRKAHHISAINVLEPGGQTYVYDLPAYQVKQREVSFSIKDKAVSNELVEYDAGQDNSLENNRGRDGYFNRETMDGYAHSFLLTGILSPDYVDVLGDGITDDDLGTAIKFNYSRVDQMSFGKNASWPLYKWRMPIAQNKANFNEGLKSDDKDDKGLYTYGEKELWYLHTIESKNMVATFRISNRNDGKSILGEDGGISPSTHRQKKLDRIDIYTKAEYEKYGSAAKPITTVNFAYSYKLCQGYGLNSTAINSGTGKLTLDSLWFSYNGNQRQRKNKYVFKYSDVNPNYNPTQNDRWGTYKDAAENPSDMPNKDYPYTNQDKANSDSYASAWCLKEILLPSGGLIEVNYEADDYAYVQDRRASQMTAIAGFGLTSTSSPSNQLYSKDASIPGIPPTYSDHRFVFFDVNEPIAGNAELRELYMQDFKQLLLKLWVKMPAGSLNMSAAYEPVVVYSAIKSYGLVPTGPGTYNHNRFYIELVLTKKGGSPIVQTVLQFMKDNLPQRAYPGREVSDQNGFAQLVTSIWGLVDAYLSALKGFESNIKSQSKCKDVNLNFSFARLNNPSLKKIGGGHRVKSVIIRDNWKKMSGRGNVDSGMHNSFYGQIYSYTTTQEINGEMKEISSGVATYEPGVGNEENPFREVLQYTETQPLGPTDHNNVELPVTETFFPSSSVGYSKVVVRSVHNRKNSDSVLRSGIGLQQTEFYTARDFPVLTDYSSFDHQSRHHHKPSFLNKVFKFNRKDYLTLTQGFRVVLNDMHGKMKSQTSFPENDLTTPINYTGYHYRITQYGNNKYRLDNVLPVISGADGKLSNKMIGRDVEVMNDFRQHFSYTYSANIPLNAEIFMAGPIPIFLPSVFRMAFRDESMYRSASTMKVVNEFGILDSVINIDKGSMVSTKNLVYDAESGDVLLSRTNNEFNKPVYQFNYPAWWVNTGMEPAYRNIDLTYPNVLFRNGKIEESPQVNMNYFESGDEIYVMDLANKGPMESAACVLAGNPFFLPQNPENRIWALDVRKDLRHDQQKKEFVFIDRHGNPYNAANATIRVIRSGKRNMAGTSVGSVVSMTNPIRTRNTGDCIIIDDTTDVINSNAVEFKEKWRATDQFFSRDTMIVTVRRTPIRNASLSPDSVYSLEHKWLYGKRDEFIYTPMNDKAIEVAKKRRRYDDPDLPHGKERVMWDQVSWAKFNLSGLPTLNKAVILNATLNLGAHISNHLPQDGFSIGHHYYSAPHLASGEYRSANPFTIKLTRMRTPWYSSGNAGWEGIFKDNSIDGHGTNYHLYNPMSFGNPFPDRNFNNVDVKKIVQSWADEYATPSAVTGIKIAYENDSEGLTYYVNGENSWRYCFGKVNGKGFPQNYLNLTYYQCAPTDSLIYQGLSIYDTIPEPPGYYHCKVYAISTYCFSVFTRKYSNPYITGVLTSFKPFRSYVFYGSRREKDFSEGTDISKDGVIEDFVPYWAFNTPQLTKTEEPRWVWNSEITQYNRKGAELENHDPLDRYNAGIYGYQESLPIAVVNNSRYRLAAFDGFEDYKYKDDPCEPFCKPSKRHFRTDVTGAMLDTAEAHTGRYSVRINQNTSHRMFIPVSANDSIYTPDIRIGFDSTVADSAYDVRPNGTGRLKGTYYHSTNFTNEVKVDANDIVFIQYPFGVFGCTSGEAAPGLPTGVRCNDISIKWEGWIQVPTSGIYWFGIPRANDEAWIYVNDTLVAYRETNNAWSNQSIYLRAGVLNKIEIRLIQESGVAAFVMEWRPPGTTGWTSVPDKYLYPLGQESLADNTVTWDTAWCVKPDTIQAIRHYLIDSFNLIPGKKIVASVWMKQGGEDCHCTGYTANFTVRDSAGKAITTFQPRERIIEGWQQFEAIFTVPATSRIRLDFNAPADANIYIDDLRLHPFNANMKSFVYDATNLRLSAELDENNFATFYEYDDEGTLVRVKKETRLGIKTLKETRSSLQKGITDF